MKLDQWIPPSHHPKKYYLLYSFFIIDCINIFLFVPIKKNTLYIMILQFSEK